MPAGEILEKLRKFWPLFAVMLVAIVVTTVIVMVLNDSALTPLTDNAVFFIFVFSFAIVGIIALVIIKGRNR